MSTHRLAALVVAAVLASAAGCTRSSDRACAVAPVATAGADRIAARNTVVELSGAAAGARGDVSYAWRLESMPAGSAAALSGPDTARPTLTPDVPGVYVASLTVRDACGPSAPDLVVVTVPNSAPVALAGSEVWVEPGASVVLDGSASADLEGDPLTYRWSLAVRPSGSAARLAGADGPGPTLTTDVAGTYVAILVVSDGLAQSAPSAVAVHAGGTNVEACLGAARPVARAGPDQTLTYATTVYLSGSGSTGSTGTLTYRWTLTTIPAGSTASLTGASTSSPTLWANRSGVYVATLVVNDGCQDSAEDSVTITLPNHAPTVSIWSVTGVVPVLVPTTLSAYSYDQDGDPVTYTWSLASAPAGSTSQLRDADSVSPSFVPDVPGQYVISLVVSDGSVTSAPATATVTAANQPPVARAGSDRSANVGATVTLDGSSSTDANGTQVQYAWTLTAPAGSAASLAGADGATPSFVPDVVGSYVARLVVSDGENAATDTVTVAVWPAVERLPYRVIDAAYSDALDLLVLVSADPSALHLRDPRTGADTTIALDLPPSSVSVGPDGRFAAVGHMYALTYVDLVGGVVVRRVPTTGDVAEVALGNGYACWLPRSSGDRLRVVSSDVATGAELYVTTSLTGAGRAQLTPSGASLYVTAGSTYSYMGIEHYDVSRGMPVLVTPASSGAYACGDLWMSRSGSRLFTGCGSVYRVSSSWLEDLVSAGSLSPDPTGYPSGIAVRQVADSPAAGEVSAITSDDASGYYSSVNDRALRRYRADGLVPVEVAPFPTEMIGGTAYPWSGRFVFYRSDGSERYVVLQLPPTAGALQDFGLATY